MAKQGKRPGQNTGAKTTQSVRIDRWLWAARFYKTRSLASEAIKGGKISCDGVKVKASREVRVGDVFTIKQSWWHKTVVVRALSEKRGPASQAALLYEETPESIEDRERLNLARKTQPQTALRESGKGRPTKRERRQIISFTQK